MTPGSTSEGPRSRSGELFLEASRASTLLDVFTQYSLTSISNFTPKTSLYPAFDPKCPSDLNFHNSFIKFQFFFFRISICYAMLIYQGSDYKPYAMLMLMLCYVHLPEFWLQTLCYAYAYAMLCSNVHLKKLCLQTLQFSSVQSVVR